MSTTENPAPVKAPRKPKSVQLRHRVVGKPHRSKPFSQHKRVLRPSITPGTVLILLTGVHRGRRVVCLRQLASGLLLVTGPYCVNGVPLRRVHQKFVIATRTKLDVTTVEIPESVNDAFFQRARKSQRKSTEKTDDIFAKKTDKYSVTEERKDAQKTVDKALVAVVKAHSDRAALVHYLRTPFSLSHGDRPHNMIF